MNRLVPDSDRSGTLRIAWGLALITLHPESPFWLWTFSWIAGLVFLVSGLDARYDRQGVST